MRKYEKRLLSNNCLNRTQTESFLVNFGLIIEILSSFYPVKDRKIKTRIRYTQCSGGYRE